MHTTAAANAKQEIAHLLDPSYHRVSASPTPSALSESEIWTDAAGGTHDPDFRPFVTSTNNTRRSSFDTRRSSFDTGAPLPSAPVTPTKDERRAARRALQPDLALALKQHERQLRDEERAGAGWMRRTRAKSSPALGLYDAAAPLPVISVPELVLAGDSDDEDDGHSVNEHECVFSYHYLRNQVLTLSCRKHHLHAGEQLRRQLASLSLKVDLAVFRAKKRIRRKVGLA